MYPKHIYLNTLSKALPTLKNPSIVFETLNFNFFIHFPIYNSTKLSIFNYIYKAIHLSICIPEDTVKSISHYKETKHCV